jgi:hypothetical protein
MKLDNMAIRLRDKPEEYTELLELVMDSMGYVHHSVPGSSAAKIVEDIREWYLSNRTTSEWVLYLEFSYPVRKEYSLYQRQSPPPGHTTVVVTAEDFLKEIGYNEG